MQTVLDRKLLVITGKGGVGKTTIAAACGLLAAQGGRRVVVVEVGQENRLPELFGVDPAKPGIETRLRDGLWSVSIDPDRALLEWLQALGGRVSGRVLASSGTFQYFAAAAPGAKELVAMVKIWRLTRGGRARRDEGYDLVVLDAPATGHALGLLSSPHTFGAIARVGPIAGQTREVQQLLETPSHTAYMAVALATEMAVTEVLEIEAGLHRQLGRQLSAVVVNALLPRRFTAQEMGQIESLEQPTSAGSELRQSVVDAPVDLAARRAVTDAAIGAARAVHDRARFQHNQLARLRRRNLDVIGIPFSWSSHLDLAAVTDIARRLERGL